jgi:hypothetical protein
MYIVTSREIKSLQISDFRVHLDDFRPSRMQL